MVFGMWSVGSWYVEKFRPACLFHASKVLNGSLRVRISAIVRTEIMILTVPGGYQSQTLS